MLKKFSNNPVFRLVDRIPGLRRSGTASLSDLAKALGITLALCFLMEIPQIIEHPMAFLISLIVLVPLVGVILLAHPFLSHRATLAQSFGFKKRAR